MAFKKKPDEPKKGAPEYMNTYGDMVTLMLTFFVLLFSMSSIDVDKFKALAESFSGRTLILFNRDDDIMPDPGQGFMPDAPVSDAEEETDEDEPAKSKAGEEALKKEQEVSAMASDFKTYMAQNAATSSIAVDAFGDVLRITFPDGMLFDSGKAVLKPEAVNALNVVADAMVLEMEKHPNYSIRVEGHTDNVPMRNPMYPSNRHLSSARADTVVEYLVEEKGYDPKVLSAEGMGEYWPVATNDTPEGRAKNRRVEIKIYASQNNDLLTQ